MTLTKRQRLRRLINDSNYPSRLGQELIGGSWILGSGWTEVGEDTGTYATDGTVGTLAQTVSVSTGKSYYLTLKAYAESVITGLSVSLGSGTPVILKHSGSKGVKIVCGGGSDIVFSVLSANDFIGDIKSIHLREILS